ncbi:MAG: T9SS type A sorting domain-containing protein [Candidatus Kapabacteria bacterium]|nr:T9SS type A sorting domain-containing protein [Candidatus Kapabacteria bacterium]
MKIYLLIIFVCTSFIAYAESNIIWNPVINISTNTYGNMHPRISLDGLGNPLIIWGRMSDQSVYFSRWTGNMFTVPVKLNPSWLTVATASWMGPDISSKGDTVYVVVKRAPETDGNNRIFIFTSFNGGISFNTPVELAFIADSVSRFPTVTTDSSGNPIVAFMKFNSSFLESRWVIVKSIDYGKTFNIDVKASGWGNSSEVCDCCPGAVISSGNTCALLYRDNNSNIRDCWAGISTDNADIFKSGFALENNKWSINSCPASGPDGVIIGDNIYSVFMNGASGNYRNYLSKSSISTGKIESVSNLSGTITGLSQQNYPRIATDGNAIAVVWKQTVSGTAQLPILFTNNAANGFTSSSEIVDISDITNTDVAMSKGNIFVVWQDDNSGTVKYRSGTYLPSTSVINQGENNNYSIYPNPAKDFLNIISPENRIFSINVINSLGEIIYSGQSISNTKIETSKFSKGIYILLLKSQNHIFTQKFIIE